MTGAEVIGAGVAVAGAAIMGFVLGTTAASAVAERQRNAGHVEPTLFAGYNVGRALEVIRAARAVVASWDDYETCKVAKERLERALGPVQ